MHKIILKVASNSKAEYLPSVHTHRKKTEEKKVTFHTWQEIVLCHFLSHYIYMEIKIMENRMICWDKPFSPFFTSLANSWSVGINSSALRTVGSMCVSQFRLLNAHTFTFTWTWAPLSSRELGWQACQDYLWISPIYFTQRERCPIYFTWASNISLLWALLTTCNSDGAWKAKLKVFNRNIKTMLHIGGV